ncbi:hypothetical protein ABE82_19365 [Paenibacillus peoriae]|uniref:Uncharacterized protein n=1 Tax=Paenibacillus polymyxa TaxID=1406 RepID=A0ABX2Z8P5_PAEPO|nr:hypothetical protein ABE82_19365 [Paenibacillus peoriae]ODA06492.1 hypothetical protein A7312_12975 [Paenibacillus polymyxa]
MRGVIFPSIREAPFHQLEPAVQPERGNDADQTKQAQFKIYRYVVADNIQVRSRRPRYPSGVGQKGKELDRLKGFGNPCTQEPTEQQKQYKHSYIFFHPDLPSPFFDTFIIIR